MRAPDAVAPPPGHPRFVLIDSLRAVAALGVLVAHVGGVTGANDLSWYGPVLAQGVTGVTVFFVISGFLLYRPFLAADLDGLRPVRWLDFGRRRLLRILPAYWLALTIIGLWLGLPGVFGHDWWRYYLLLQVYSGHTVYGGLFIAWTLCIEASFYLYLPFHAAAMSRLGRRRSRPGRLHQELVVLAVLAAISIVLRYEAQTGALLSIYLTLLTTFAWFALGMALAVLSVGPVVPRVVETVSRHPAWCWLVAGVVYLVLCALLRQPPGRAGTLSSADWMAQYVLSAVIAVTLVAPAALGDRAGGWPRRVMAIRWLAAIGLVSYGVYLWQIAFADQFGRWITDGSLSGVPLFPVVLAATVIGAMFCATVSYRAVERPLMRFKNRRSPGRDEPAPTPAAAARRAPS